MWRHYLVLITVVCLTFACLGQTVQADQKKVLTVGSKIDTEGALLGQMILLMLEDNGLAVKDKTEFGPTPIVRKAIMAGEIDIYPEYTGNGAFFFSDQDAGIWKNRDQAYERVKTLDYKKNKLVWLTPAPADNTWALAVREAFAREHNLTTLGDLARYVNEGGTIKLAACEEFLLMDEPFGALDPISRENLQNQFLDLQNELNKTVVFVTHDIDEAVRLGSKVALLRDGALVQYATPEILLSSPADSFVKRFVGLDRALKRLSRLSAKDFIHPALWVQRHASSDLVEQEFKRMESSDCARYLWVTESDGRLIGWIDGTTMHETGAVLNRDLVGIDPDDFSVFAHSSLKHALSLFVQQGVVCLPVVDREYRIQGEIRLADILQS